MQQTLTIYDNAGYSEKTRKQKYQVLAIQEVSRCLCPVDGASRITPSDVITAFELWMRAHLSCVDIGFGCVDADVEGLLLENRWHQLWLEAQREIHEELERFLQHLSREETIAARSDVSMSRFISLCHKIFDADRNPAIWHYLRREMPNGTPVEVDESRPISVY